MSALLVELQRAVEAGDSAKARSIAGDTLAAISPSGILTDLAARTDSLRMFDDAADDFDGLQASIDRDELALAYLDREGLLDRLEDDLAKATPILCDAATSITAWAIPILSALAGPAAPLLSVGLTIAVKLALALLQSWAKKRLANQQQGGK